MRPSPAVAVTSALLLMLGGCDEEVPTGTDSGDPLNQAEAGAVAGAFVGLLQAIELDFLEPDTRAAGLNLAGEVARVPVDQTFDRTMPCEAGGTRRVSGSATGELDSTGGLVDLDATATLTACRIPAGTTTLTLDTDPSIGLGATFLGAAQTLAVTVLARGSVAFTAADSRNGICAFDFSITVTMTGSGNITRTPSGTVCGADAALLEIELFGADEPFNSDDALVPAEVQEVVNTVIDVLQRIEPDLDGPDANANFDASLPCPWGGTISVAGTASGTVNEGTGHVSLDGDVTVFGCRVRIDGVTITLAEETELAVTAAFGLTPRVTDVQVEIAGELPWDASDGRSGTCALTMALANEVAPSGGAVSQSVTGSACGVEAAGLEVRLFEDDGLAHPEVQLLADELFDFVQTAFYAADAPPAHGVAAARQPARGVPIAVTFNESADCAAGGTRTLDGSVTGEIDDATGNGSLEVLATVSLADCAVLHGGTTITFARDFGIGIIGDLGVSNAVASGDITIDGEMSFTTSDGRSGACDVDMLLTVSTTLDRASTTAAIIGTLCGVDTAELEIVLTDAP